MKKIALVASAGGHLDEISQLVPSLLDYDLFFVVPKTEATEKLDYRKYFINDTYEGSKFQVGINLIRLFIKSFKILIKEMPSCVITTGASVAIPISFLAKLMGRKIIYIESMARINELSATGKLFYKFADLFIVQWVELTRDYPKAMYRGWIY